MSLINHKILLIGICMLLIGIACVPTTTTAATKDITEIKCTGEETVWLTGGYGPVGPMISAEDAVGLGRTVQIKVWFNHPVDATIVLNILNESFIENISPDPFGNTRTVFYYRLPENLSINDIPFKVTAVIHHIYCEGKKEKVTLQMENTGTFEILECTSFQKEKLKKLREKTDDILTDARRFVIINTDNPFLKEKSLQIIERYENIRWLMKKSEEYENIYRRCAQAEIYMEEAYKKALELKKIMEKKDLLNEIFEYFRRMIWW